MKKAWAIYLPLTLLTFAPVAFVFSCGSKKEQQVVAGFQESNSLFSNNAKVNAAYDQIKEAQATFQTSQTASNYIFENSFVKFVFEKTVVDDILKGQENALKLIRKAIASMNITSQTHLNHDGKNTVEVKKAIPNQNAGGYSVDKTEISIEPSEFQKNFQGAIEFYAQVINHEWGHYETVMPINSKYGTNAFTDNLDKVWNDFIINSNDAVLKTKTLSELYDQEKKYNHKWQLEPSPFSNPRKWFDIDASQIDYWKTNVIDAIRKAPDMELGDVDANSFLAELITRIQLSYTYGIDPKTWLDKDIVSSILMRNLFSNQIEAMKILNYNLYDDANNLQALNIMTSIFKNIYNVGNSSGVEIKFSDDHTIQAVSFESLGMNYESGIKYLALRDGKNLLKEIPVNHEDVALGFYRNIFSADKEYKTIVKSSYLYSDGLAINAPNVANINVVLEDQDKKEIPDVKLQTTLAQKVNKNFNFEKNSW